MTKVAYKIVINQDWCKACGICIALCASKVFAANDQGKAVVVNENACNDCKSCILHCPDFCIEKKEL